MGMPSFPLRHGVEFMGFYLPPLALCALVAVALFLAVRWLFGRVGLYRFVWHRPLFNLALYVLLLGGVVFLGDRVWQ